MCKRCIVVNVSDEREEERVKDKSGGGISLPLSSRTKGSPPSTKELLSTVYFPSHMRRDWVFNSGVIETKTSDCGFAPPSILIPIRRRNLKIPTLRGSNLRPHGRQ